jgi:hypothetical protein
MSRAFKLSGVAFTQPGLPSLLDFSFFAPNVVGWWLADYQLTVNGSNQVTGWTDQSGLGNTLTNAAPASSLVVYPGQINGLPAVSAPSVSAPGWVASAAPIPAMNFQSATPFCVVVVLRRQPTNPVATAESIVGNNFSGAGFAGWQIGIGNQNQVTVTMGGGGRFAAHGGTNPVAGTLYSVVMTYDGSGSAAGIQLYLNGVAETMTVVTNTAITLVNNVFTIGGNNTAGIAYRDADYIGEVAVLNMKPSSGQLASIFAYTKAKWGA